MARKDRDSHRRYDRLNKQRVRELRRKYITETLGGVCRWCGSTDKLECDHVHRGTKCFNMSSGMAGVSWVRFIAEVEKCQLLCRRCHLIKCSREERGDWYGWDGDGPPPDMFPWELDEDNTVGDYEYDEDEISFK